MSRKKSWAIEVSYKPGVTDAAGDSVRKGINDLGIKKVSSVKTVQKYILNADLKTEEVDRICRDLLANPVIQTYKFKRI